MEEFFIYITKSAIALSFFCLAYKLLLKSHRFFGLNRAVLISILLVSVVFPLIHLPQSMLPESPLKINSTILVNHLSLEQAPLKVAQAVASTSPKIEIQVNTWLQVMGLAYFAGLIVSFFFFGSSIKRVIKLIIGNKVYRRDGFKIRRSSNG